MRIPGHDFVSDGGVQVVNDQAAIRHCASEIAGSGVQRKSKQGLREKRVTATVNVWDPGRKESYSARLKHGCARGGVRTTVHV